MQAFIYIYIWACVYLCREYICIYVCMCALCICMWELHIYNACVHVYICKEYTCICMCICVHVHIYVCMWCEGYVYVFVYIHMCMCVQVCVNTEECLCVCRGIYVHICVQECYICGVCLILSILHQLLLPLLPITSKHFLIWSLKSSENQHILSSHVRTKQVIWFLVSYLVCSSYPRPVCWPLPPPQLRASSHHAANMSTIDSHFLSHLLSCTSKTKIFWIPEHFWPEVFICQLTCICVTTESHT